MSPSPNTMSQRKGSTPSCKWSDDAAGETVLSLPKKPIAPKLPSRTTPVFRGGGGGTSSAVPAFSLFFRAAGGNHVFEHDDRHAGHDRAVALDEALRTVILLFLAHVKGRQGSALLEAHERHRAREGTASELDAGDRSASGQLVEGREHQF